MPWVSQRDLPILLSCGPPVLALKYGHSLDPVAPLSGAVGEFTPPLFVPGEIAQFDTLAWPGLGLILAVVAMLLAAVGLWAHRRAYKPIIDAQRNAAMSGAAPVEAEASR